MKKIWILSLLLACVLCLTYGCGIVNKIYTKVDTENSESITGRVGDNIKLGNITVTVVKAERSDNIGDDMPEPGNEFIILTITIKNDGDLFLLYDSYDFKLENSKGIIIDPTGSSYGSGGLAKNGSVTGTVTYEEPKGDKNLTLVYKPQYLDNKTIIKVKLGN